MSVCLFFVDKRCKLVRERHQIASSDYPRTLLPGNYPQRFQFLHLDKFAYNSFPAFYLCTQRKWDKFVFEVIHQICEIEEAERIIASRSNKDENHFTKWDKLLPLLDWL